MKLSVRVAAALAAACLVNAAGAQGTGETNCPVADAVEARHLVGLWRAQFDGLAAPATLLLEPHPEYAGSLRGEINRDGQRAWLSAEVDAGEFSLEESVNGVNITAVWMGDVVDGTCGREIRGGWKAEGISHQLEFVLRKAD